MPYLKARGLHFRYRVTGDGPPLLLIRGLTRCMDFWLHFEPLLRPHFTVICMDNRGVGGSDKPLPPYSTAMMGDDCAAVVRALGFAQVDVFGVSLGGMIAQKLALRHPGLVRRLALGCTTPGGRHGRRPPRRALARLATLPFRDVEEANRRSAELVLSDGFRRRHPELLDRWLELLRRWPVRRHAFLGQLAAAMAHGAGDDLPRLHVPTLILSGDSDRLLPPVNSERLADLIPDARLVWLPGAGHEFQTEQPEETVGLLREFFLG